MTIKIHKNDPVEVLMAKLTVNHLDGMKIEELGVGVVSLCQRLATKGIRMDGETTQELATLGSAAFALWFAMIRCNGPNLAATFRANCAAILDEPEGEDLLAKLIASRTNSKGENNDSPGTSPED